MLPSLTSLAFYAEMGYNKVIDSNGGDGMPGESTGKRLTAPAVMLALVAVAASRGIPILAAAMLLLPPVSAVLAVTSGWWGAAMVCAGACGACILVFPPEALPLSLGWCILCAVIPVIPLKKKAARPFLWAGLCLGAWITGIVMLLGITKGQIVTGLAQIFCDWVEKSPQCNTILLNAYSMGYSRLEGTAALVPAVQVMGHVLISEDVKMQMLYSLRVSLEGMLPSVLCETLVYHTAVTTLLSVALPDWRRRKAGAEGELPPMERWYIPRGLGLALMALCLGRVVALFSSNGAAVFMGWLCWAVFKAAYVVQGLCLLQWMEKRMGIRSVIRNIWAVVLSILAPIIPMVMGMVDQRRDSRHLRPHEEVE